MRAISIQVQPERSRDLDLDHLIAVCSDVAAMKDLVDHHQFDRGHDKGPYLNFTFGTQRAASLWRLLRTRLYEDEALGPHMHEASMAMCSSTTGWNEYVLLYHFDPAVKQDPDPVL